MTMMMAPIADQDFPSCTEDDGLGSFANYIKSSSSPTGLGIEFVEADTDHAGFGLPHGVPRMDWMYQRQPWLESTTYPQLSQAGAPFCIQPSALVDGR
jgi:hypothetical protein